MSVDRMKGSLLHSRKKVQANSLKPLERSVYHGNIAICRFAVLK